MSVDPVPYENGMELFKPEIINDGEHRVVVQAPDRLKFVDTN